MKKRFFLLALAAVVSTSISTTASRITVVCCNNSIHSVCGVSPEAFRASGASDAEVAEYCQGLAQDACGGSGCYRAMVSITVDYMGVDIGVSAPLK